MKYSLVWMTKMSFYLGLCVFMTYAWSRYFLVWKCECAGVSGQYWISSLDGSTPSLF